MSALEEARPEWEGKPIYLWPNVSECMKEILAGGGVQAPEPKPTVFQRVVRFVTRKGAE